MWEGKRLLWNYFFFKMAATTLWRSRAWQSANTCRLSYASFPSVLRIPTPPSCPYVPKKDILGTGSTAQFGFERRHLEFDKLMKGCFTVVFHQFTSFERSEHWSYWEWSFSIKVSGGSRIFQMGGRCFVANGGAHILFSGKKCMKLKEIGLKWGGARLLAPCYSKITIFLWIILNSIMKTSYFTYLRIFWDILYKIIF